MLGMRFSTHICYRIIKILCDYDRGEMQTFCWKKKRTKKQKAKTSASHRVTFMSWKFSNRVTFMSWKFSNSIIFSGCWKFFPLTSKHR
jgi:hypothetical protein